MTGCSKELGAIEVHISWELAGIFPSSVTVGVPQLAKPRASAVSLAVNNVPKSEDYSRHADGPKAPVHIGSEDAG